MEKDDDSILSLSNLIVHSHSMDPKDPNAILRPQKQITPIDFIPKVNYDTMWNKEEWNGKFLIHAESYWKLVWDVFIFLDLLSQGIYVPFSISFDITTTGLLVYYDFVISLALLTDIIFNFNTGYFKKGTLIMNRKLIAFHYLKSWFMLDLLSSFPYTWIIDGGVFQSDGTSSSQLLKSARLPRFFKIIRLLRFAKIRLIILKIEDSITHELLLQIFHLFRFLVAIYMFAHWIGCLWYYTGSSQGLNASDSWVRVYEESDQMGDLSLAEKYVISLYWAFTTLLTIGYGDIHAHTTPEKIVAMICMVFASAFYGYAIGSIHEFVERTDLKEKKHREEIISMTNHLRRNRVPKDLQFKVRSYLEYVYENQKNINIREDDILNLLSEPLKNEISAYIHYPAIKICPTFSRFLDLQSLTTILKNLKEETYAPGDEVLSEGEKNRTIYIIIDGSVYLYYKQMKAHLAELRKGSYFGEVGFFVGHSRTASVKCSAFSDLLTLKFEDAWRSLHKDVKAQEALNFIQSVCEKEDYSQIGVTCYICKRIGHVALKCNYLWSQEEETKKEWLAKKMNGRKKINPHDPRNPTHFRRRRHTRMKYEAKNILGIKRSPEQMYKNDAILRDKASHYISDVNANSVSTSLSEASAMPKETTTLFEVPSFYRYTMILPDTDSDEEEEAEVEDLDY
ncbi:unnamed protein product [Blepharisma stoltei]|uniref:Cyclic nucleotide-binding domain-containing protein n=1 Tax=Blepharisma stoltei TaxID=1481888 RepID=A0AAU9JXY5_9CILI|nr:unnamed protein product [Blepharisma stoltei]